MLASNESFFTPTEQEVLRALIRAGSVTGTSHETGRAVSTLRVHLKHIHAKTDTHNIGELIVWALSNLEQWAA